MRKTRIVVGISGGVDSSVAALLLKQQGYDVSGVFMRNWEADNNDSHCSALRDLTDARTVCEKLDIPFHTVNFSDTYWNKVFQHFLDEYAAGRTPNPDILCNKEIKFRAFLDHALAEGADYLATGHYARCQFKDGHYQLLKAKDSNKDQTYFLSALTEEQLQHALFPLGDLTKAEVRAIAAQAGLITHDKKDSTGICFIGERRFKDFLKEYLLAKPGNIETEDGKIIGRHEGLMFYTIGQRKGIGIGGKKDTPENPWFVLEKDIQRGVLIVGQGKDHPKLYKKDLYCQTIHWINQEPTLSQPLSAKIRYRQMDETCQINPLNPAGWQVTFEKPQRAITPGQSVVFYQDERCLGCGVIQ